MALEFKSGSYYKDGSECNAYIIHKTSCSFSLDSDLVQAFLLHDFQWVIMGVQSVECGAVKMVFNSEDFKLSQCLVDLCEQAQIVEVIFFTPVLEKSLSQLDLVEVLSQASKAILNVVSETTGEKE